MVSLSYLGKPILKYRSRISKAIVTLLLTYLGRTAIFVQQKLYTLPQWNRQICRWSIPTILATIIMTGLLTDGLYNTYGAILNNPPVAWCVRQSLDQLTFISSLYRLRVGLLQHQMLSECCCSYTLCGSYDQKPFQLSSWMIFQIINDNRYNTHVRLRPQLMVLWRRRVIRYSQAMLVPVLPRRNVFFLHIYIYTNSNNGYYESPGGTSGLLFLYKMLTKSKSNCIPRGRNVRARCVNRENKMQSEGRSCVNRKQEVHRPKRSPERTGQIDNTNVYHIAE